MTMNREAFSYTNVVTNRLIGTRLKNNGFGYGHGLIAASSKLIEILHNSHKP